MPDESPELLQIRETIAEAHEKVTHRIEELRPLAEENAKLEAALAILENAAPAPQPRRGRPPGSKNKPKS